MKYFIDTEFIEKPNTIDLISIGIVCEDGRKYYALNKELPLKEVWKNEWLRKNVLYSIYSDYVHGDMKNHISFSRSEMKCIFKSFGSSKKQIAHEIRCFVAAVEPDMICTTSTFLQDYTEQNKPEFYGYYADYDWVVFCWLFGKMIDLPKGFPMYCKDLKQMMDDKGLDKQWKRDNCPDPEGEHNALVDAKWNMKLYNLIQTT